ncbi:MAG: hypothetical protein KDC80_21840 [Saprospiraceae bacterium]|nr:hypothetical protein [Saprospiraceae bacterium]
MEVPDKYHPVILEALEDLLYKVSLDLSRLKGQPLTRERKMLTKKQSVIEELQHLLWIEQKK